MTVPSILAVSQSTGGDPEVVLAVFAALLLATGLSLYLALRLYRGYRRGSLDMLLLGIGLVLLTTVPMVLRFVLSNVPTVAPAWREVIATSVQLLGLFVILGVVYGRR